MEAALEDIHTAWATGSFKQLVSKPCHGMNVWISNLIDDNPVEDYDTQPQETAFNATAYELQFDNDLSKVLSVGERPEVWWPEEDNH